MSQRQLGLRETSERLLDDRLKNTVERISAIERKLQPILADEVQNRETLLQLAEQLDELCGTLTALLDGVCMVSSGVEEEPNAPGELSKTNLPSSLRGEDWEPELVRVPEGNFWMGTDRRVLERAGIQWEYRFDREFPYHQQYLPEYWISKYPVINAEFDRFADSDGYRNRAYWTKAGWSWLKDHTPHKRKWNKEFADHPVASISCADILIKLDKELSH